MTITMTMLRAALGTAALVLAATAPGAVASPVGAPPQRPAFQQSHGSTAIFPYPGPLHEVRGVVRAINGTVVVLQTRRGMLNVDASYAMANYLTTVLFPGRAVLVHAALNNRTFVAHDIQKERLQPAYWPADR